MFFNYRLFFRHIWGSLCHIRNENLRYGSKRIRFLVFFILLFPGLWLCTQIGFLADHLFFGKFRAQQVKEPVFILGNFRSGSTLLLRLLAQDTATFSSIRTWEIYSAPSITQRKFLKGLRIVDAFFGGKLHKRLMAWNNRQLGQVTIHKIGVYEPEEDEGLLYYIWYGLFVWFFFPDQFNRARFDRFDHTLSSPVKKRIMRFYRMCIKRHLYYHGGRQIYLSKNPAHTGKIDSLLQEFPDSHIVYLYRDPHEMISSTISWFSFAMHYFADITEPYPYKDLMMDMARHYYIYPHRRLRSEKNDRYIMINYEDLRSNIESVVTMLYKRFGITMNSHFQSILRNFSNRARTYSSTHRHSPAQVGITNEELSKFFGDIIDYFPDI